MRAFLILSSVLVPFLSMACYSATSEQGPDILEIFDQMVISRAAANRCAPPTPEHIRLFEANFGVVSIRAIEEVKTRRPSITDPEVMNLINGRTQAMEANVDKLVAERGCADEDVALIVRRFEVQATWDMSK
jgi:hypothetical protein